MKASAATNLATQRELLVLRAELQRLQLARDLQLVGAELNPSTWALRAWDSLRAHPSWWLVAAASLVAARRAGLRGLLAKGMVLWRAWEVARRWLRRRS